MATWSQYRDFLNFMNLYQRVHDRGPTNIECAAHCDVSTRTICNWKRDLVDQGAIEIERIVVSVGRSRLETWSWVTIAWKVFNQIAGTFRSAIIELRKKRRKWMNEPARLRSAIFAHQRYNLLGRTKSSLENEQSEVAKDKFWQPLTAIGLVAAANERLFKASKIEKTLPYRRERRRKREKTPFDKANAKKYPSKIGFLTETQGG